MGDGRTPRRRRWSVWLGLAALAAVLFGGGVGAGIWYQGKLDNRFSWPARIKVKVEGYYNSLLGSGGLETRRLPSNRVPLVAVARHLPLEVADYAGGISAFGEDGILLLDRTGKLFLDDGESFRRLDVAPPFNGIEDLRRDLADGKLGEAGIDFKWFRYNDVLYLERDGRGRLFASFTEWTTADLCFRSTLAELDIDPALPPEDWRAEAGDWRVTARTEPCLPVIQKAEGMDGLEAGGRLARRDADTLVWTSGSYGRDDYLKGTDYSKALGQDPATDYGKVLLVDLETGAMRRMARGLRNPQGAAVAADGTIWVTDHGQRGGDELNRVTEGANFGYPAVSYGTTYSATPIGNRERHAGHDGYDGPVVAFVPSVSPSSVLEARGFDYAWEGDILVGAYDGHLRRVHVEDGRAVYVEAIPLGTRIRDMARLDGGARIALWTDDRRLIRLAPDPKRRDRDGIAERIAALPDAALRADVAATYEACGVCHSFSAEENRMGPHLVGLCGRRAGAADGFDYSPAIGSAGWDWTEERLAAFIRDPQATAPGNRMEWGGLDDAAAAQALAGAICAGGTDAGTKTATGG
jgi:aldose sugar dehydrogenase